MTHEAHRRWVDMWGGNGGNGGNLNALSPNIYTWG